jgi:hypothetical protein
MKTCFFLVGTCSANTSTQYSFLNSRMNRGSHSSLATPRSLQQRIRALLLHASVAVGIPEGSKYSCSPRAIATRLQIKVRVFDISELQLHSPPKADQSVLPADYLRTHVGFATRSQAPTTWTESLVQDSAILDLWKINHAVLRLAFRQRKEAGAISYKTTDQVSFRYPRDQSQLGGFQPLLMETVGSIGHDSCATNPWYCP